MVHEEKKVCTKHNTVRSCNMFIDNLDKISVASYFCIVSNHTPDCHCKFLNTLYICILEMANMYHVFIKL